MYDLRLSRYDPITQTFWVRVMIELWKDCIGWEDCYQVSNLGRVRSKRGLDTQVEDCEH